MTNVIRSKILRYPCGLFSAGKSRVSRWY